MAFNSTTSSGSIIFNNGNVGEIARFDSSGNLGLGVTPSAWASSYKALQVGSAAGLVCDSTSSVRLYANAYYDGTSLRYINSDFATQYSQYQGVHRWFNAVSGTAGNAVSFTQAMTLDASGRLIVNATSAPTSVSGSLNVTAQSASASAINVSGRSSDNIADIVFSNNAGSTYYAYIESAATGSGELRIQAGLSGGVKLTSGATSWVSLSDERLKTDLKPIENAAQKVSTLRAVTGRFKTDEEGVSRSFLIAQDVQAVLPEAVDASDPDKLGLQYTDTIPLLVAAIKELTAELNELKQRIN